MGPDHLALALQIEPGQVAAQDEEQDQRQEQDVDEAPSADARRLEGENP